MSIKEKLAGKRVYLKRIKQLSHISNIVHSRIQLFIPVYIGRLPELFCLPLSVHFFGAFVGNGLTKIA
jgi:hypothetical protein